MLLGFWQRYQRGIGFVLACALIAYSLIYFLNTHGQSYGADVPSNGWDFGDYRYLAEKFWGIEHNIKQYHPDFAGGWGYYLDMMPFRGILPGTLFLITLNITKLVAPEVAASQLSMTLVFFGMLKLINVAAYLVFYMACARRFGVLPGLALLCPLLFAPSMWYLTQGIHIGEPIIRPLFVLLAAALIAYHDRPFRLGVAGLLLIWLCCLCKPQWLLLAAGLFGALCLIELWRSTMSGYQLAVLLMILMAIPGSILAINTIGWGVPALTPGTGLHASFKNRGHYVVYLCKRHPEEFSVFCNRERANFWWRVYLERDVPQEVLRALDRESMAYLLKSPRTMWHDLRFALRRAQDSLGIPLLSRACSYMTWLALLLGLLRRDTFLYATLGIGLWIIPAIGNMFSAYDARYYHVMSGIPLVMTLLIIYHYVRDENIRLWLKKRFSF